MKYIIFIMFILLSPALLSQLDKPEFYDTGRNLYYELFAKQAESKDSMNLTVQFRISMNLLRFTKSGTYKGVDTYTSSYNVEIEFRDADGIIRKRINLTDSINTSDYDDINKREKFVYHSVNFNLLKSKFFPVIRLFDVNRTKLFEEKLKEQDFSENNGKGEYSSLIFSSQNNGNDYHQYILNSNGAFSSQDVYLMVQVEGTTTNDWNYTIEYLDTSSRPVYFNDNQGIVGKAEILKNSEISLRTDKYNGSDIEIQKSEKNSTILICTLPSDRNIPGKYRLTISDTEGKSIINNFNLFWERMPTYLLNPQKAAEIMYFIMTDNEHEQIRKLSGKETLRKIFEWWKAKDPTKFSVYNEAMVEYFNRAEFALNRFKTNFEKDGALSDRGKIFILNGKPDNLTSEMQISGQNVEVWNYRRLNKKYIFETDINGVIYLKDIIPY